MGLLMSALGGAASAGVNMLQDERKNDAIEERDVRLETLREQLQAKRAETVARIAQETELAHQKRDQAQYDQIDDNAKSTGYKRDADAMKKIGADFSADDAKELSPAVRSAYQKAGLIGTATDVTDAKDRADEGRRIGAHPTIRKELDSVYQTASKEARAKAELESREKIAAEREATREYGIDKRSEDAANRLLAVINKSGGSNKSDTKEWMSLIESQRKGLDSQLDRLSSDEKTELALELDPRKKLLVRAKYAELYKPLEERSAAIDADVSSVRERFMGRPDAPKAKPVAEKPKAEPAKPFNPADFKKK